MKRKIFSVLFALVLVVSMSLVTAVPAGAVDPAVRDREMAIIAAADRLVDTQNDDGGFTWYLSEPPTEVSGDNVLGITAIGILKAHELEDKATYETALAKAYGYATGNTERYVYPDVTFLVWLADAAEADTSLLDAINTVVSTTTTQDIRTLAQSIWDARMFDGTYGDERADGLNLDAAERAVEDLRLRDADNYAGLGFWDLGAAVKAALALENPTDANAIAGVMYDNLQSESPYYFDIAATSTICYVLALSGTIEAFLELGVYPTMARTMTDELIAFQDETGFWDEVAAPMWYESVQSTAYAVMALVAQGDPDALVAAQSGSDWLVNTQHELGGWNPCEKDWPVELLEGDSEAAWALASAEAPVTIGTLGYYSIQSAINSASPEATINVAAGTYNPIAPIVVDESLTITGDTTTPGNVIINALTGGVDMDCFQVIANNVTIQGFRIVGAMDADSGVGRQNAGIMVGSEATLTTLGPYLGISGGTFSYNEIVDCSKGLYLYHATNCEVSYNTITTTEGQDPDNFTDIKGWNGDGVHVYLEVASDYPTGNIISHNTMDNVRVGVFLNGDTLKAEQPSAWDFSGTTIEDNTMTNVWNTGIMLQCASGTAESPIIININDIDTSTVRRAGDEGNERGLINIHGDYTVITGNALTNSAEHGLWVDGSHHMVEGNIVTSNTKDGIHVGAYKKTEPVHGWTLPVITRADITIQTNNLANVGSNAAAIFGEFTDSIAILGNIITDFARGGIVVRDTLVVHIVGNTISSPDNSIAATNGIQIGPDWIIAPTGTIKDNQVSGCRWGEYDPELPYEYHVEDVFTNWTASGILVIAPNSALEISGNEVQSCDVAMDIEAGPGTSIEGNDVLNNSYGFVLWNAIPTINFNNIYQNALYGVYRTTVGSSEGILDATKNWWDDPSGPDGAQSFTEETYTGLLPGFGDSVSGNVKCMPWLTRKFQEVLEDDIAYFGVSFPVQKGWNIVSAPLALDAHVTADGFTANTWGGLQYLGKKADGDGYALKLHYTEADDGKRTYSPIWYYDSDPDSPDVGWQWANEFTEINPVDAFYIRMMESDSFPVLFSPDLSVPSKKLSQGWNLVGCAYMDVMFTEDRQPLLTALATIAEVSSPAAGDVTGYSQVVSPPVNQPPWIFIPPPPDGGTYIADPNILPTDKGTILMGKGYWVFMENPGTLAGLTFTPISLGPK